MGETIIFHSKKWHKVRIQSARKIPGHELLLTLSLLDCLRNRVMWHARKPLLTIRWGLCALRHGIQI